MSQTNRILSHLNPKQQEVVAFGPSPLLVLAGAGSGKTRTLTHRAAYLIQKKKALPENLLLLTFTNKAAGEMKKRIQKLLPSIVTLPFAGTFHSFCARILRREGKHSGIPPNYLIYDEGDQLATVKLAMAEINISPQRFKPASILNTISQAKNELISALEYPHYVQGEFQTTAARIYLTYQRLLKEYRALDFDDLLFETVNLFQKQKAVLEKYQDRYRYILIDEYQDTNQAQYEITRLLVKKYRHLTVVGDASQSIYGWRGANYRNLMNLKKDFPELKIINLEQNYRSTSNILKAANEVIKKNTAHPILNLWTKKKGGEKIILYEAYSEIDEANFVINQITANGQSLSNFSILYRTNAQSRTIEEAFLRTGIPYLLVGGTRFYERKEVRDCLAYLRLINNFQDQVSYERIQKLGKRRLQKLLDFKRKLDELNSPANGVGNRGGLSTLEILDRVLEATNYWDLYDQKEEADLARIENIKELRSVASQFPDLSQFLENVALVQQEYLPATPPAGEADKAGLASNSSRTSSRTSRHNAVTLMTIHAAKGTEFPTVFVVGLEEGLFPHSRSLLDKDGIEEERRLCYVGMTRARKRLYLSYARRRLYFGRHSHNPPSRFLGEIPPELIDFTNNSHLCED